MTPEEEFIRWAETARHRAMGQPDPSPAEIEQLLQALRLEVKQGQETRR